MKIGIDISSITPSKAGIGYYTFSIVNAINRIDKDNDYTLFTNEKNNFSAKDLGKKFKVREIKSEVAGFKWIWNVSKILSSEKYDLFISPTNFSFTIFFPRTIQIIHDLAPIKFPEFFSRKGSFMYKLLLNFCIKKAYKIGVPLNTIRNDLIEYNRSSQEKIFITNEGLHDWTNEPSNKLMQTEAKRKYNLPETFLLSVSTIEPRKNHLRMIRAFTELSQENKNIHYVIVGKKGWYYEEVFEMVERFGLEDRVHFTGYMPEEDLPPIFDLAKGFLFCSFYEGFGIPPLEAYARGIPVLCSDIPSIREVFGDRILYADPKDYWDIFMKMKDLLDMKRKRPESEFLKHFSWEISAKNIINEYN